MRNFGVLSFAVIAGHDRHAGFLHERLGAVLEAHGADGRGGRPDEDEAGLRTSFGKIGVLGQKAIARMNALGAGSSGGLDQPFDREIAFARLGADRCK